MTTPVGWSYLLILPAFPREAYLWLADRSGGKLPTTTTTGRFSAWSFVCKRWKEPVRLIKRSTKERSSTRAETFPFPTAQDHTATGRLCQPWGCQLHNSTCLAQRWAGAIQPPLGSTQAATLGQPGLQPPAAQMVVGAPRGAHGHRAGMQEEAASQTTSLMWAMVPTALPTLCAKCSRWWLSDLASLTLHQCGYGAATWRGHWKRGLKSAHNCFPEGVYFLPADRHDWMYKHSLPLWGQSQTSKPSAAI